MIKKRIIATVSAVVLTLCSASVASPAVWAEDSSDDFCMELTTDITSVSTSVESPMAYFYCDTDFMGESITLYNAETNEVLATMLDDGKYSESWDDLPLDGVYSTRIVLDNTVDSGRNRTLSYYAVAVEDDGTERISNTVEIKVYIELSEQDFAEMNAVDTALSEFSISEDLKYLTENERFTKLKSLLTELATNGTTEFPYPLIQLDSIQQTKNGFNFTYTCGVLGGASVPSVLNFLPQTESEFNEFVDKYGTLSVHDKYIVYCDKINYSTGVDEVVLTQSGSASVEKLKEYNVPHDELQPEGSPSMIVVVYEAVTAGDLQVTVSQVRSWDPDSHGTETGNGTYTVNDDLTIVEADTFVMGDVNDDGSFNVSDVVLLQKWLLAVPDTHLANWRAADFCEDERLDVFDLCLMKRALVEKVIDDPQIVDDSFELQSIEEIRYNDDNHTQWKGFIARSESELADIIDSNENGLTDVSIDSSIFSDKSVVIVYSICSAGNRYSIIDDISVNGTGIDVSTVTKEPMVGTPDMLFRRYVYIVDKNAVANVSEFTFNDTLSYYQYEEQVDVANWFNDWCQA